MAYDQGFCCHTHQKCEKGSPFHPTQRCYGIAAASMREHRETLGRGRGVSQRNADGMTFVAHRTACWRVNRSLVAYAGMVL